MKLALLSFMVILTAAWVPAFAAADALAALQARPPQDEVVYFLLPDRFANGDAGNDRGGLSGERLITGFDPTDKAFYHGGDLKGLVAKLDYIQGLGATAVWLTPIFVNKPVQGAPGQESAGYHGYWITDFTRVDPHLGDDADMRALVAAAHARGLKIYMDIVVNHTADVIAYRECPDRTCPYRSKADYPYSRQGGLNGAAINPGFLGEDVRTQANFDRLTNPNWAYTPFVPKGQDHAKVPDWLNDVRLYHNRGDSTFRGENSTLGDFSGLDDLMTENPRVVRGFIDIFGEWIDRYGVDGFRIDTAKHVDAAFWADFVPAILARARARGVKTFQIFGEVATDEADTALLAQHTRVDHLPSVLDFALRRALIDVVARSAPTTELQKVFDADALYEGGAGATLRLQTFVSNHDNGRFAWFLRQARPGLDDVEAVRRLTLAYAMLFSFRGSPVVYYGDEQGFAGLGGDQGAREDMFATQTAQFAAEARLGGGLGGGDHFDTGHPLYRRIADLTALRQAHRALRGGRQIVRAATDGPGLFAVSRIDPVDGHEVVAAFNTSDQAIDARIAIDPVTRSLSSLAGSCPAAVAAPGVLQVKLPALGFVVCEAEAGR